MKKSAVASAANTVEQAEERLCLCGCGLPVSPKRFYKPGHDARHVGQVLRAHDKGDAEATKLLLAKGWRSEHELKERAEKAAVKTSRAKISTSDAEVNGDTKEDVA